MPVPAPDLPVHDILPDLLHALEQRTEAVLQAPPGAGKTTIVPLALLDAPWRTARIIVLEPRRLAARAAAHRMASLLGEPVGRTVGYRVRLESRVSRHTAIEVVTEGILTRMLQSDPSLESVSAVLFDEFHERSLQADLGLALTVDARAAFREDLRVLVMSATLDGARIGQLLGDCPVLTSEGRLHPVDSVYLDRPPEGRVEDTVATAVRRALRETDGDVLAFLPGAGEIRRTAERLVDVPSGADVRPLYGALSFEEQDAAIQRSPRGRRKVVLATDIAETSLTIEGIRAVVDSGLSRGPLFDSGSGMTRLVTRPISRASAEQRRGRAGRLGPGVCYRLWTRMEQGARPEFAEPEIRHVDLAPLALELAAWGVKDAEDLIWLDRPDRGAFGEATRLLHQLGALAHDGSITTAGRRMVGFGTHPRLAHMLLEAPDPGLAADLAALVEERDPLRNAVSVDVGLRVEAIESHRTGRKRDGRLARIEKQAREFRHRSGAAHPGRVAGSQALGPTLAAAYPDRIAQRLRDGHFRLRNGHPVTVREPDPLAAADFLVVADLGGGGRDLVAFLAAEISAEEIRAAFGADVRIVSETVWNEEHARVDAVRREVLDAVVLSEGPASDPDPEAVARTLLAHTQPHHLPWDKASRQLQNRLAFLSGRHAGWPDRSSDWISGNLVEWLLPFATGLTRRSELRRLDLHEALLSGLDWPRRQELDRRAPTHLEVPTGSRIALDYGSTESPILAVRLQEVFGLTETPRVDGVPVTMHLLSPAQRPVQVTQDLAGFWQTSYFDVRKDMRGRYPKHYWPENPLEAEPTRRTKPRGSRPG